MKLEDLLDLTHNRSAVSFSAAGIYVIQCTAVGQLYVGSTTTSFNKRFNQHRHDLRRGKAGSQKLQRAWDKYGEATFDFVPLVACEPDQVLDVEQQAIDALNPTYNMLRTVGGNCLGQTHPLDVKLSASGRAKAAWAAGKFTQNGKTIRQRHLVHGELLSAAEICAKYGLSKPTVGGRIRRGYAGDDLAAPVGLGFTRYEVEGEKLTLGELAAKYDVHPDTVLYRARAGLSGLDLIQPSRRSRRAA